MMNVHRMTEHRCISLSSPKEERAGVRRPIKAGRLLRHFNYAKAGSAKNFRPLTPALSPLGGERECQPCVQSFRMSGRPALTISLVHN